MQCHLTLKRWPDFRLAFDKPTCLYMKLYPTVVLFICAQLSFAQSGPDYKPEGGRSMINLGLGGGLNYGGLGASLEVVPMRKFALFAAAGFTPNNVGFNVGIKSRLLPNKGVCPVLMAMYGYNGVLSAGSEQYRIFYGPSLGGGAEFAVGKKNNFIEAALLFPIRSREFDDYMNYLRAQSLLVLEPFPVTFSIGYHFRF